MTSRSSKAEKKGGNSDYKLPYWAFMVSIIGSIVIFGIMVYFAIQGNTEKEARQASSPHTTQAGQWMRDVALLPDTPERKEFISELGIALADGVISDEEHATLFIDYQTLQSKR